MINNTAPGGNCILNVPQKILPGARFSVMPGKKITVAGNLLLEK
jgi:hypothetical protein